LFDGTLCFVPEEEGEPIRGGETLDGVAAA